jgi:ribonucleoside-diphosphate reductase beta chain
MKIWLNFVNEVQYASKILLWFSNMMENIHSETYSLLIDICKDEAEKIDYLMHWKFFQLLRKKRWALQWIESDSFAERLIAFAAVFFSGAFLFYLLVETWINARLTF